MLQSAQNVTMHRVVSAINNELKDEFVHFPSTATLQRNAEENFQKYHLPDFAYGVDGVHMTPHEMSF